MCIPKNTERGTPTMPKGRPVERSRSKSSSILVQNKKMEKSKKSVCATQRASSTVKVEDKKVAIPKEETKEKPLDKSDDVKTDKGKASTHERWNTAEPKKNSQIRRKKTQSSQQRSKSRATPQKDLGNYSVYIVTVITEQFENAQVNPPTSIDLKKALCNRVSNYAFEPEDEDEENTLAFVPSDHPTFIFPALQISAEPEVARPKLKHIERVDATQDG